MLDLFPPPTGCEQGGQRIGSSNEVEEQLSGSFSSAQHCQLPEGTLERRGGGKSCGAREFKITEPRGANHITSTSNLRRQRNNLKYGLCKLVMLQLQSQQSEVN